MTRTEQWAKRNGVSDSQLRECGMMPDQIAARSKRTLAVLEQYGHGQTELACALRGKSVR
jgi:hypothetical protein